MMKLAALALAAVAAGPIAPPQEPPDVLIPAQCMRGVCVVPQEVLVDLMKAHNELVDEQRELKRRIATQCGERGV